MAATAAAILLESCMHHFTSKMDVFFSDTHWRLNPEYLNYTIYIYIYIYHKVLVVEKFVVDFAAHN